MKKETKTVVYDDEIRIEAYRFEGIAQGDFILFCLPFRKSRQAE